MQATLKKTLPVSLDRCHRCGGLRVPESDSALGTEEWRCVSCGDRVDPVILAHRQGHEAPSDTQRLLN
jgi:hypothetical protein